MAESPHCEHEELKGTYAPRGICKNCGRDLDAWFWIKKLWESYLTTSGRLREAESLLLSPCCHAKAEPNDTYNCWYCTKCKKRIYA